MEQKILQDLRSLPDLKMDQRKQQEMLANILHAESKWSKRERTFRRFARYGKGVAVCSLLLAAIWFGSQWLAASGQTALPPETGEMPKAVDPINAAVPEANHDPQITLLQKIMERARQGKVINADFAVETSVFDSVEKKWGKPDTSDFANGLTYATYQKQKVVFGYNKGRQVVEVRSYDPALQSLTLAKVKEALGSPASINNFAGEVIYVYNASEKYQLKLVLPAPTRQVPNPHVDHINVLYPQGTNSRMLYGNDAELLQAIAELAREGKVIGSEFAVERTVFDTVEQEWGKPNRSDFVNGLTYAAYEQQGVVYGVNKGMQVAEIRSYDPRLQELTMYQVKQALGKPNSISNLANENIYVYNVNEKYQL
jgi:hypothetical protein